MLQTYTVTFKKVPAGSLDFTAPVQRTDEVARTEDEAIAKAIRLFPNISIISCELASAKTEEMINPLISTHTTPVPVLGMKRGTPALPSSLPKKSLLRRLFNFG